MLKKFFISITKSLIVLLLATLIFSSAALDLPTMVKGLFGDIFSYASPDVQKQTISKLAEACSSLDQGQSIAIQGQKGFVPDLSGIGKACNDYKSGKADDKKFFFDVIGSSLGSGQIGTPNSGVFDKYNNAINYLNNNKLVYFAILLALIVVLYLLFMDIKLFVLALTGISFSIGVLLMVPYLAILAYGKFVGFDTTPILSSILGGGNVFDFKALASVILLLFLKTYNTLTITIGVAALSIGIAGKVYGFELRRENRATEETKKEAKAEEPKTEHKIKKKSNRKFTN